MTTQPAGGIDLHQVLLEIEEDVREKRASGALPADVEKELDLVFSRFAPPGAVDGDFDALVQRAEQQSFIDLLAPNESVRPGVPQVKRVVQKTIRWYLRYVAEQVGGFAHSITRAVKLLGERVETLEQGAAPAEGASLVAKALQARSLGWNDKIVAAFDGTTGRVLHARCGNGSAVEALRLAGIDAYGVDPASEAVAVGTAKNLDLRPDDERHHMGTLAAGVLGGLLLTEVTDVLARGAQIELVEHASLTVCKGGTVVLLVHNPATWDTLADIPTDLAPGRPMRTDTWKFLMHERGFTHIEVQATADSALITAKR